jgi:hypothetical protein
MCMAHLQPWLHTTVVGNLLMVCLYALYLACSIVHAAVIRVAARTARMRVLPQCMGLQSLVLVTR